MPINTNANETRALSKTAVIAIRIDEIKRKPIITTGTVMPNELK